MKIALCISGSLRNSEDVILKNVRTLEEMGHKVNIFAYLETTASRTRLSLDTYPYSLSSYNPLSIKLFNQCFESKDISILPLLSNFPDASILTEDRTFEDLLSSYNLGETWNNLCEFGQSIPMTPFQIKPFIPHFMNTFKMLSGIWNADQLRIKSDSNFDIVIRLRPDFLMSSNFVSALDNEGFVVPIRSSTTISDYGWGHMSDMCFACSPTLMSKTSDIVNNLNFLWDSSRVFVKESVNAPFMYGDVIVSYWVRNVLDITPSVVPNGGDLVRESSERYSLSKPEYWEHIRKYLSWLKYSRTLVYWRFFNNPKRFLRLLYLRLFQKI